MNMIDRNRLVIPLLLIAGLLYFFRPWIQPALLTVYTNPFLIQGVLVALLTAGIYYRWRNGSFEKNMDPQILSNSLNTAVLVGAAFIAIGGVANTAYSNVAMSNDLQKEVTEIDTLPDIDNENPRILPRTVANEFAENSLQEPRHRLAPSDIAITENGTPVWSFPLQPDGNINRFIIKQKGAAFADMTTSSSDISYSEQEMDVGIGMQIFDNINWQLPKQKYWVNYEDHFVLNHDGENYIATPYVEYDLRFRFPVVFTVPEWGGTALTDSEGNTEYIEREDIQNHEILGDQRNYPFDLARKYVSSMEYREGIINQWFFHENQLEVAPVPGFQNEQPFMILTEDNPELFVATEPYGQASGLFEIWTIDAVDGGYEVYRLDRDQGLIGANRAVNFVRQANSRVNWADRDSDTGFAPIEPLPVIVDDRLYWQVRVVPLDSAGIAFTSFVDAETSDVYTAQDDQDIRDFLEGQDINQTTGNQTEVETGGVEITIIEDGEVVDTVRTNSTEFDIRVRDQQE